MEVSFHPSQRYLSTEDSVKGDSGKRKGGKLDRKIIKKPKDRQDQKTYSQIASLQEFSIPIDRKLAVSPIKQTALQGRTKKSKPGGSIQRYWSAEKDLSLIDQIKDYVEQKSSINWSTVSIPNKSKNQIQQRWYSILRPDQDLTTAKGDHLTKIIEIARTESHKHLLKGPIHSTHKINWRSIWLKANHLSFAEKDNAHCEGERKIGSAENELSSIKTDESCLEKDGCPLSWLSPNPYSNYHLELDPASLSNDEQSYFENGKKMWSVDDDLLLLPQVRYCLQYHKHPNSLMPCIRITNRNESQIRNRWFRIKRPDTKFKTATPQQAEKMVELALSQTQKYILQNPHVKKSIPRLDWITIYQAAGSQLQRHDAEQPETKTESVLDQFAKENNSPNLECMEPIDTADISPIKGDQTDVVDYSDKPDDTTFSAGALPFSDAECRRALDNFEIDN